MAFTGQIRACLPTRRSCLRDSVSCDKEKLCIKLVLTYTDAAGELVLKARAGDHGKFLVDAAEKSDKLKEIEIKKQNLGTNPVSSQMPSWKLCRMIGQHSFNSDAHYCFQTL
jgi:hypothetical protein